MKVQFVLADYLWEFCGCQEVNNQIYCTIAMRININSFLSFTHDKCKELTTFSI